MVDDWLTLLELAPGASSLEICQAFERLVPRLAPHEFANRPCYFMPASALPAEWLPTFSFCGGWYHDLAYDWLKPHLPEDRGSGPAAVVLDIVLPLTESRSRHYAALYERRYGKPMTWQRVQSLASECRQYLASPATLCPTLVHELAHAISSVCDPNSVLGLLDGNESASVTQCLTKSFKLMADRKGRRTEPEIQLDAHSPRFTRIVAHLDHRLRMLGLTCPDGFNAAGEKFEQAPYAACFDALIEEVQAFQSASFQEILATPWPAEFHACQLAPEAA